MAFFVFVGGRPVDDLKAELTLADLDVVSFVKLVPLVAEGAGSVVGASAVWRPAWARHRARAGALVDELFDEGLGQTARSDRRRT